MNTADPRHYTLPKTNLYIDTETFLETGASPLLKLLPIVELDQKRDILPARQREEACRQCRYYEHEGRRGGHCKRLNVAVQGQWKSCVLSEAIFLNLPGLGERA
jgi:hypothetical protein